MAEQSCSDADSPLVVTCGELRGHLDAVNWLIQPLSDDNGAGPVNPADFERLAGRSHCKRWRTSIRVMPKPGGTPPRPGESDGSTTLSDWALMHGVKLPSLPKGRHARSHALGIPADREAKRRRQMALGGGLQHASLPKMPVAVTPEPWFKLPPAVTTPAPQLLKMAEACGAGAGVVAGSYASGQQGLLQYQLELQQQVQQLGARVDVAAHLAAGRAAAGGSPAGAQRQGRGLGSDASDSDVLLGAGAAAGVFRMWVADDGQVLAELAAGETVGVLELLQRVWLLGGCEQLCRCGAWSLVAEHVGVHCSLGGRLRQLYAAHLVQLEPLVAAHAQAVGQCR